MAMAMASSPPFAAMRFLFVSENGTKEIESV